MSSGDKATVFLFTLVILIVTIFGIYRINANISARSRFSVACSAKHGIPDTHTNQWKCTR